MLAQLCTLIPLLLLCQGAISQFVPFSAPSSDLDVRPISTDMTFGTDMLVGLGCSNNCQEKYEISGRLVPSLTAVRTRGFHTVFLDRMRARALCPNGEAVVDVKIPNGSTIQLTCKRIRRHLRISKKKILRITAKKYGLGGTRRMVVGSERPLNLSEESGKTVTLQSLDEEWVCDDSYYAIGMECADLDCNEVNLICAYVEINANAATEEICEAILEPTLYGQETPEFGPRGLSEVVAGPVCGIACRGSNCEQKRLLYVDEMNIVRAPEWWSGWFSSGNGRGCPLGMIVSQINCDGPFCSLIELGCSSVGEDFQLGQTTHRGFRGRGEILCYDNEFVTGLSCRGPHCAEIELWCTPMECS